MAEMEDLLHKIIEVFNIMNCDYVIVGGFAAILNGSPRTTTDIDIIIRIQDAEIVLLIQSLINAGFDVMEDQIQIGLKEGSNVSIFHPTTILRIDLKRAKSNDEIEVLKQSVHQEFKGIKIRIASIEQILYGKIIYLGDISDLTDEELVDYNDVKDFIRVFSANHNINLDWLENKAKIAGLTETLKRLKKLTMRL
jgi:hypothetical protein